MRSLLPCLLAFLLLVGCSEKETEEVIPEPEPAVVPEKLCYLQHIQMDISSPNGSPWSLEENFTYVVKGQLFSEVAYVENNVAYGSTYKYDAKGRITREDMVKQYSEPEGYYTYAYDAEGKLQAFTYYAYDPAEKKFAFASRNVCEYVNAKQLKAMYNYTRVNGKEELTSTTEYTYTDGNMTKATRYDGNKHKIRETTLTYDDQKNFITALPAYRAIMVLNGFPHEHNILSQIVTDAAGDTVTSQSYIRNITYTDRGYLQRSTSTFLNGRVQQYTYTYDCD